MTVGTANGNCVLTAEAAEYAEDCFSDHQPRSLLRKLSHVRLATAAVVCVPLRREQPLLYPRSEPNTPIE